MRLQTLSKATGNLILVAGVRRRLRARIGSGCSSEGGNANSYTFRLSSRGSLKKGKGLGAVHCDLDVESGLTVGRRLITRLSSDQNFQEGMLRVEY